MSMLEVKTDGTVLIRRADYIWRSGKQDKVTAEQMGDGNILGTIHPEATQDIVDAQTIAVHISLRLKEIHELYYQLNELLDHYGWLMRGDYNDQVERLTTPDAICDRIRRAFDHEQENRDYLESKLEEAFDQRSRLKAKLEAIAKGT